MYKHHHIIKIVKVVEAYHQGHGLMMVVFELYEYFFGIFGHTSQTCPLHVFMLLQQCLSVMNSKFYELKKLNQIK